MQFKGTLLEILEQSAKQRNSFFDLLRKGRTFSDAVRISGIDADSARSYLYSNKELLAFIKERKAKMRKTQVAAAKRLLETGMSKVDVAAKVGVSFATIYTWHNKGKFLDENNYESPTQNDVKPRNNNDESR